MAFLFMKKFFILKAGKCWLLKVTRRIEREAQILKFSRELSYLEKESDRALTKLGEICYDLRFAGLIDADLSTDQAVIDLIKKRAEIRGRITSIQQKITDLKKV